eukprot:TRINITY_DN1296_c0_g1_i2.p1 TRINITY_DN1296_c0_g1~~TRINITY_DN1296_c0_g1_i2.p1  ORF type:complete len:343 (-),score=51.91 TRINITY_DN1296_c0_g1_i2:441-1469(-)
METAQYTLSRSAAFMLGEDDPTYVMDLALGNNLLAAAGSDGIVKLYTQSGLELRQRLTGHTAPINQITFLPTSTHILASASSDGNVICWDTNTGAEICRFRGPAREYFCLAVNSTETLIAAGSECSVTVWNLVSKDRRPLRYYEDAHTDTVAQILFHPQDGNVFVSGSVDGLVSFYNVTIEDLDESLIQVINTENAVSKMGFFGPNREFLFATTNVETFSIWNAVQGDRILHLETPREELGRVFGTEVNYIIGCHYSPSSDQLFILCGTVEGKMMIAQVSSNQFIPCQVAAGGHQDVVRSFAWDFTTSLLATGGEDSRLCIWRQGTAPAEASSASKKVCEQS